VSVYQTFQKPPGVDELDLEGISSDGAGGLLVACEYPVRILRIGPDSSTAWYTPPLKAFGSTVGLFQLPNATVEGVARLSDGRLVLAAERSERGLIELPASGELSHARAWSMPRTPFALGGTRLPDFSDLATADGALFALVRNGHLVVRLERTSAGWNEQQAWSFARAENDAQHAYFDRRYGVAEGLAMDENFIDFVLDNNADNRLVKRGDIRSQLLIFDRPAALTGR